MNTIETIAVDSSQWEWAPCTYDFKQTSEDGRVSFFNLAPSVTLSDPKGGDKEPKVEISIELEKNFIYSEELGWNWHKSWNIPNMKVRVEILDPETNEKLPAPKELNVQVYSVKAMIEQLEKFHLLDIGMKGEGKKFVVDSEAYFSALKFSSTSYNNDSVRFHLVVCVQIDSDDLDESPQILNSFISPPIFVDSRKSARDTHKIKAKHVSSLIDPFLPENLDKVFIKRENRRKDCNPEEITNSIEGLINYFTAPNIRHKVKHPLFLALKFSNCISLHYNRNIFKSGQEERLVESIQQRLYESSLGSNSNQNSKPENVPLIMILKNVCPSKNIKNKKIMEHLESIQSNSLMIMYDNGIVPSNFKEITNIAEVKAKYKRVYSSLTSSKFKVLENLSKGAIKVNEDEQDDENDEAEFENMRELPPSATRKGPAIISIPVQKQSGVEKKTVAVSVSKGGLPRPSISEYEKKKSKVVKTELESSGFKTEEDSSNRVSVRSVENANNTETAENKSEIVAQLEMMNRLLMINAAIGIKNQREQQSNQTGQNSDVLGTLIQSQDSLAKMDMDQLTSFVQGFLGQNSTSNQPFSTSVMTESSNRSNFPSSFQPRQSELQNMLRQTTPQSGGYNSQLFRSQNASGPMQPLNAFSPLSNTGMQSNGLHSQFYSNFQQPSFASMLGTQRASNFFPHLGMTAGFPNYPVNFNDMIPQAFQFSQKQDFAYEPSQRQYPGVKEEFKYN